MQKAQSSDSTTTGDCRHTYAPRGVRTYQVRKPKPYARPRLHLHAHLGCSRHVASLQIKKCSRGVGGMHKLNSRCCYLIRFALKRAAASSPSFTVSQTLVCAALCLNSSLCLKGHLLWWFEGRENWGFCFFMMEVFSTECKPSATQVDVSWAAVSQKDTWQFISLRFFQAAYICIDNLSSPFNVSLSPPCLQMFDAHLPTSLCNASTRVLVQMNRRL